MKRKREAAPQLSAFAARKLAEAQAPPAGDDISFDAKSDLENAEHCNAMEDQVEEFQSDGSSPAESDLDDQNLNTFAALSTNEGGPRIHGSRSMQVAEAEKAAKFVCKVHKSANEGTILGLAEGERVSIQGYTYFRVLAGCISVNGATLDCSTETSHYLAASKMGTAPVLQAVSTESVDQEYFSDPVVALVYFDAQPIAVSNVISSLGQYPLGKVCLSANAADGDQRGVTFSMPDSTSLSVPPIWIQLFSDISTACGCYLSVGSKGVGKSTLVKWLLNKSITPASPVYYLDLDPGQPELSPPGMISLYLFDRPIFSTNAACAELVEPLKSHWIGDTSPKDDPTHYLACISDLVNVLARHRVEDDILVEANVIVNTPGWIKGTGKDLLILIAQLLNSRFPQQVKVLAIGHVELAAELQNHLPIISLPAHDSTALSSSPVAADLRTLNLLSYFHRTGRFEWFPDSLALIPRWSVSFASQSTLSPSHAPNTSEQQMNESTDGIYGISVLRESLSPDHLIHAILGTIVAVSVIPQDISLNRMQTPEGLPMVMDYGEPLDPAHSSCLGLALIVGINLRTHEMHLITPIPTRKLRESGKIVLVTGSIEVPLQMMVNAASKAAENKSGGKPDAVPYTTDKPGEGIGWQNWHVRRNIGRRVRNT